MVLDPENLQEARKRQLYAKGLVYRHPQARHALAGQDQRRHEALEQLAALSILERRWLAPACSRRRERWRLLTEGVRLGRSSCGPPASRRLCGRPKAEPSATYLYGWVRAFFHPLPAAVGPFAKWTRSDCGDKDRWATTRSCDSAPVCCPSVAGLCPPPLRGPFLTS